MEIINGAKQLGQQGIARASKIWSGLFPAQDEDDEKDYSFFQGFLQVVLWIAFAAFLFASLPHVAYFFASFEPESSGQVNDYWWLVSYSLAIGIDVTSFLLSLNVAIKMRRATAGLGGVPRLLAKVGVIITHWPFIIMLVAFSWLVNFEHAKEFHSLMLDLAENVDVNLIIWQGKLGDLNPIIASAFPVLAVAYTGMSDRIGGERRATRKGDTVVTPVQPEVQFPVIDTEKILKTVAEMQAEMLNQFKVVTVELVKETVERQIATIAVPQLPAPDPESSNLGETTIQGVRSESINPDGEPIQGVTSEGRYTSPYALQIEQLYQENDTITVSEVVKVTGCARTTARKWLAHVRTVVLED